MRVPPPLQRVSRRPGSSLIELLVVLGVLLLLLAVFLPQAQLARETARRTACSAHFKKIILGLHAYHDFYGTFPLAVTQSDGSPIHDWRGLTFNFLDGTDREYDPLVPWNSGGNLELAKKVPAFTLFTCPSDPQGGANVMAVQGEETMWPYSQPLTRDDFPDGIERTIAVVEVRQSGASWLQPSDLELDTLPPTINPKTGLGISSFHVKGVNVVFADGSLDFLSDKTPPELLRQLLVRDDSKRREAATDF